MIFSKFTRLCNRHIFIHENISIVPERSIPQTLLFAMGPQKTEGLMPGQDYICLPWLPFSCWGDGTIAAGKAKCFLRYSAEMFDMSGELLKIKEKVEQSINKCLLYTSFVRGTARCCMTSTDGWNVVQHPWEDPILSEEKRHAHKHTQTEIWQEKLHQFSSDIARCKLVFGCKETLANLGQNRNIVKGQLIEPAKRLNNRLLDGQELGWP